MSTFGYDKYETDGLGGWLVFVFLLLVITPLKILFTINTVFVNQINSGELLRFVSIESSKYIDSYYSLFLYEVFGGFFFVLFSLLLIFYYFSRHTLFPVLFQVFVVTYFLFVAFDYLFVYLMDDLTSTKIGFDYFKEILLAFGTMVAGALYVQFSERVNNTYIYDDDDDNNMWAFGIIIFISLGIVWTIFNVNYRQLSEIRQAASVERVDDGGVAKLNLFYSIDYLDLGITRLHGFKDIDPFAKFGFESVRGVKTIVFTETYDLETRNKFGKMEKDEILSNLEIYFEGKVGVEIIEKNVILKGNQEIFLFEGNKESEDGIVYYYMAFLLTGNKAIDLYSFGSDKKSVNTDGIIFIDNMKIKR